MKRYQKILFLLVMLTGFMVSASVFAAKDPIITPRCANGNPYNTPWINKTGNDVYNIKYVCNNKPNPDPKYDHYNLCWGYYNASPSQPTLMGLYGNDNHNGSPLMTANVYVNQEFIPTCAKMYAECHNNPSCKKCLDGSCPGKQKQAKK